MQTPEPLRPPNPPPVSHPESVRPAPRAYGGVWALSDRLAWLAAVVLTVSAFTNWYSGDQGDGLVLSVIGWHTGALGKLVFFTGFVAVAVLALREVGLELPATVPESLVLIALGSLASIFVLIRIISIPDTFFGTADRGIGIWISLVSALALIVSGLARATEEL
ncbi:MAG TPA: hypothetical protein VGF21_19165 [Thermoleophilaceae bacterium]